MAIKNVVGVLVLVLLAIVEATTPPGIANNPSHARCLIKKYKMCYNLEHVCPKFCPDSCTVECVSCKPICGAGSAPPPDTEVPSTPDHGGEGKSPPPSGGDDDKGGSDGKGKSPPPSGGDDKDHGDSGGKGKSPPPSDGNDDDDHGGKGKSPPPSGGDGDESNGKGKPPKSSPPPKVESPPPTSPPPATPTPTPSPPEYSPPPPTTPPSSPPPTTPTTPKPSPPPAPTPSPPPTTPTPSPPSPPAATPSPSPTPNSPPPPLIPVTPSPSPPISTPPTSPTQPPSTPPPPHAPYTPPQSPGDSSESAPVSRRRCRNRNYPQCYGVQHVCPTSCPHTCEVDCVTCKPVCKCDMPGAVCQDPRFIGGDGITFYFHGKKDKDFCLVTESNFQINAHFIGRRNHNMNRDFTWVQSIGILFGDHQLFVGAQKTATWDDAVVRLALAVDSNPIALPATDGSTWQSPTTTITRDSDTNSIIIQVNNLFKISVKVVPITKQESKVHNYGITEEDVFAHLELGFKFYSLTGSVNGVLGQTYGDNYVSRAKMGVAMPVLGGEKEFAVSNIFAADCSVSKFQTGKWSPENKEGFMLELPSMQCGSGIDGRGVICKK